MPASSKRIFTARNVGFGLLVAVALFAIDRFQARRGESAANAAAPADRPAAPGFTVATLDGTSWSLAAGRGHVVLINIFATWCPPCRAEMPDLADLARDYQAKGVRFLGLSVDQGGAGVVGPFVQQYHLGFPVAVAEAGSPITAGINAIPVTLIIDRAGRVARTYVGRISLVRVRADLDQLAKET